MSGALRGVGLDLVAVSDVAQSVEVFGDRYLARVFTTEERARSAGDARGRDWHLASCFAAKEAVLKALGAVEHWGRWRDIDVRLAGSDCEVRLQGRLRDAYDPTGRLHWRVSVGGKPALATAIAIATTSTLSLE